VPVRSVRLMGSLQLAERPIPRVKRDGTAGRQMVEGGTSPPTNQVRPTAFKASGGEIKLSSCGLTPKSASAAYLRSMPKFESRISTVGKAMPTRLRLRSRRRFDECDRKPIVAKEAAHRTATGRSWPGRAGANRTTVSENQQGIGLAGRGGRKWQRLIGPMRDPFIREKFTKERSAGRNFAKE
jgi:hypothetical protein